MRGICQETIDRMQRHGVAVYPPEHERGPEPAAFRKRSRWGLFDFNIRERPHPTCYSVAFDRDGWKRVADDRAHHSTGARPLDAASDLNM